MFADYQSNTPRAVQAADRLITQDKATVLFGPLGSGATKATSSVAERYKVPLIAASASSVEVYDQGYKYLFGTFTPNATLTTPLVEIVRRTQAPDVASIAILARNDLFPLAIAQEMEKAAKARGLTVTSFDKYAIGTMDHASALSAMAAAAPKWVFATGYINDLLLIRRQMAELKLTAPGHHHAGRAGLPRVPRGAGAAGRQRDHGLLVGAGRGLHRVQGAVADDGRLRRGLRGQTGRGARLRRGVGRGVRRGRTARGGGGRQHRTRSPCVTPWPG